MDARSTLVCLLTGAVATAALGCEQSSSNADARPPVATASAPAGSEWRSDGTLVNLTPPSNSGTVSAKGLIGDATLSRSPIGVPACDSYVDAMNRCYLPTLDADRRDEVLAPLKQLRYQWKEEASAAKGDENALALLTKTCEGVMEAEKAKLTAANCWPRGGAPR